VNFYSYSDEIDRIILNELQRTSTITIAELAQRVNLSAAAIHARIKRLEERGVITQYVALVNRDLLGYDMLCFIQVSLKSHDPTTTHEFRSRIAAMPEVLECHQMIGDIDYLMKVILRNKNDLQRFLMERLIPIPGVAHVKTSLALDEIKSTTVIPVTPVEYTVEGE
jgi:Lrp/AsnC family transcriptional regulator, leucine-responsive regulatory protein